MKQYLRRLLAAVCAAALLTGSACALTVEEALGLLEKHYVDPLPAAAYEAQTLDEVFSAIGDSYTYYMSAEEYDAFINGVEGSGHVGIGVAILYTSEGILINSVLPGGSAEEAGLMDGDIIIAVDGESCVPGQESDVARITGEEGSTVSITILRTDGRKETLSLVRRPFTVPTTTVSLLENGQGLVDCSSFATGTGDTISEYVSLYDDQTDLWLVDLRSNPGGVVSGALGAIGVFTGPVIPLYFRDSQGSYQMFFSMADYRTQDPTVVLTNRYSASASEIFAGAVKDYNAGIVVGGRTYGKGVAQRVLDESTHPDLFQGDCLKVTTYRFYSGAANTTDSIGVIPTLLLSDEYTADVATLLRAAPEDLVGWLRLTLGGRDFYVDVRTALEEERSAAAVSELFAALPPDAAVAIGTSIGWFPVKVTAAAAFLEVDYTSRWFTDVDDSPYGEQLNVLASYDLLRGFGDGSFRPGESLTRAELCALLSLTLDRISNAPSPFSDVPDDSWSAPYVTALYELGLVKGYGDGAFGPDNPVTQEELIAILGRLTDFLNADCHEALKKLTDEQRDIPALAGFSDWARDYAWLLGLSFTDADGEAVSLLHAKLEEIDSSAPALREQAGAALYYILTTLGILTY